jgi:hypothetical protein
MNGGARYGLLFGIVYSAVHFLAPQPAGDAALWLLIGLQLLIGAVMTWRRTRMPFAAAGDVLGSAFSFTASWLLLRGYTVDTLPIRWIIALLLTAAAMALLIGIETRVNRPKWEAWRKYMEGSSALDILLGRHIPRLQ